MAERSNLTESDPMTKLEQRRRAHSINRRVGALVGIPKVMPRRDIVEAFNHWVANKRVVISGQPAADR